MKENGKVLCWTGQVISLAGRKETSLAVSGLALKELADQT